MRSARPCDITSTSWMTPPPLPLLGPPPSAPPAPRDSHWGGRVTVTLQGQGHRCPLGRGHHHPGAGARHWHRQQPWHLEGPCPKHSAGSVAITVPWDGRRGLGGRVLEDQRSVPRCCSACGVGTKRWKAEDEEADVQLLVSPVSDQDHVTDERGRGREGLSPDCRPDSGTTKSCDSGSPVPSRKSRRKSCTCERFLCHTKVTHLGLGVRIF